MLADWKGPLGFLSDTMLRTFAASVAPQVMQFAAQWQEMVKLQPPYASPVCPRACCRGWRRRRGSTRR